MGQFCKKCGTPLRDAAKFCPSCGQKVEEADEKKTLVERVRNNDTEAWEELYKKTYPRAYTVAIQTLKNKEDALDVLQDAYVSVFKKIDTLRDESKLEAWVNRIVANRCIDHIRKYRGNNAATPFVEMTPDDSDVEFEDVLENENKEFMPEESVDYSATKKIMQGILNQLSEEQRLCVLMYYYEELSISEIADTLDCSTGTVKSRLNYARKYIKNEVENLEKKGTKLYSMAPLPFLVWMLRSQENTVQVQAAEKEVWQAIQDKDGIAKEIKDIDDNAKHSRQIESQKAEQKTAQETVRQAAKNSGKAAVKTGAKGIATKIVVGVLNAKKPDKSDYRGWQMQKYYEDSLDWETNPLYGWCEKNTKKDGSKYNLYTDGLKIYTTIDSRMQKYAEDAVVEHLKEYHGIGRRMK